MELARYATTVFGEARRTPGRHGYNAYFPAPIPRTLDLAPQTIVRLSEAEAALGRLAGSGRLLPNPHLLVRPYLLREAVASTRIEGTQASLPQLFELEALGTSPNADVEEVVNYVRAMEAGLERLQSLPLCIRLLRELDAIILGGVRGRERDPGELRQSQNWIGAAGATIETAVFVPPPQEDLGPALADWERFANEEPELPLLVQCGLLHYQFETIHPFLDGNGRLGRLLVVFFLVARGRLPNPILYLSPYFEASRDEYYARLQGVRERGDINSWLDFFLTGVEQQANDALARAERLVDLREEYQERVNASTRSSATALVDVAFESPILTSRVAEQRLGVSRPTALDVLRRLAALGILTEQAVGPRGQRRWVAEAILEIVAGDSN